MLHLALARYLIILHELKIIPTEDYNQEMRRVEKIMRSRFDGLSWTTSSDALSSNDVDRLGELDLAKSLFSGSLPDEAEPALLPTRTSRQTGEKSFWKKCIARLLQDTAESIEIDLTVLRDELAHFGGLVDDGSKYTSHWLEDDGQNCANRNEPIWEQKRTNQILDGKIDQAYEELYQEIKELRSSLSILTRSLSHLQNELRRHTQKVRLNVDESETGPDLEKIRELQHQMKIAREQAGYWDSQSNSQRAEPFRGLAMTIDSELRRLGA